MSQVAKEKRRSYRADVSFPVTYVVEGQGEAHTALTQNVSAGGMRIVGDEPLALGSGIAYVRFALPNELLGDVRFEREVEQRTLRGRVRRRMRVPPAPFHEMTLPVKLVSTQHDVKHHKPATGVEFVDVPPGVREELHRFVHVLQLNELRQRADSWQRYRDMNRP
jgi:c-di-GMP-binding flagellar brake protein YcgR